MTRKKSFFVGFSEVIASLAGHPAAFLSSIAIVVLWGITGPFFKFSDTWQLIINTGTTIVTFLMVFLIQNTQNRDTKAIQLKLDELIRATPGAHTVLLDLEHLSERELCEIQSKYEDIAAEARKLLHAGKSDTHIPEVILDQKPDLKEKI